MCLTARPREKHSTLLKLGTQPVEVDVRPRVRTSEGTRGDAQIRARALPPHGSSPRRLAGAELVRAACDTGRDIATVALVVSVRQYAEVDDPNPNEERSWSGQWVASGKSG